MKKISLILLVFINFYCSIKPEKTVTKLEKTKAEITSFIKELDGIYAVAYKDLQTNEKILINENENFHAASTMKTPVMVELFKQANENRFSINDSIIIKNDFKSIVDHSHYSLSPSDDSDTAIYNLIDKKMPIYDLIHRMITMSSNLSTNLLIDLVDAKNVMNTMHSIGVKNIKVLRGVEDNKAYKAGLNNTTTALDLMILFEKIGSESIISPDACKAMIKILSEQKFNEMIPAPLPKDALVVHKTGSITGVQHDSGIVYLHNGKKYVLVILSKNLKDAETGKKNIAKISKIIYDNIYNS
jgi:beta-lactamase class A